MKRNKMKFISVTGGVGAGKSTVLDFVQEKYNCKIVKADDVAKDLMKKGTKCYESIREAFSQYDVFSEDGIDSDKLARLIFNDTRKRIMLNFLVHPEVKDWVLSDVMKEEKLGKYDFYIFEAALIIEEGYDKISDETWYIYASETTRKNRLKEHRGYSDERIDNMFKSQLSDEEYKKHATFIIDNNDDIDKMKEQVVLHFGV